MLNWAIFRIRIQLVRGSDVLVTTNKNWTSVAALSLVLLVPSDGVVGGVAGGVCLITVSLLVTDDGRQVRSLSSKFRSVLTGLSPNSDSKLDNARATDSSLSRTLESAGSRRVSWPSKVAFQGRQETRD